VDRKLPPLQVSPDRVIRTVTGLRPYRASGFVVRSERLAGKTVVHNYGHGGAGITLSWGTAELAVEEALKAAATRAAVLGCGAVGLAAARLLQQKGVRVTIYARELPPGTTSDTAGALWFPTGVYEPGAAEPAFEAQFQRACRISHRWFRELAGEAYGVRWIETFFLHPERPASDDEGLIGGAELYPGLRVLPADGRFTGYAFAQRFHTFMIEPGPYLAALLRDFQHAGGEVVVRDLKDTEAIAALPQPLVLNCTGLGAKALFGDKELTPIKGQTLLLRPQPEIDYAYVALGDFLYMFPRKEGIVLGGTYQRGITTTEPEVGETKRILLGHGGIAAGRL